ncbi:BppU family phage baseplate upper protein [Listeria ivanovii]|uniref:BppU family phage baseplate upper protein n=1 Tax=Listeria ivanovii TaxID=1638 RepID=UPI003CEE526F
MSNLRKINATLDLNRKSWSIERIEAIQGDINSLTIAARIVLDGKGMNLTEYTPTFAVVLPGTNKYVIDDLHFDTSRLSEGYFEYTFVKEAFSVPGVHDTARFILQKADKTELSGMPRFTYYVEKDPLQGKVVAESYISDFERLEGLIADVETEITSLHDEVTSESVRLDNEIAGLDAKIDAETSKLQTEADGLQQQFDNLDPTQFLPKSGGTMTGALQFDGVPTIFQAKQNNAWWYRLTSENSTTYQQSLYPAIVSGINGVQGAGYNFKQTYLRLNGVDVETIAGAQTKATKALTDAKADSQAKANQALVDANIYTDNSSKETLVWSGSSYFLDTHIFSWDATKVKHGVLLEFSRYIPGTGVQDYGYIQYFFSKEYLVRNNNKATWINMPGAIDGAKKTVRLTSGSVQGDASNGLAPSTSYALRTVSYF